MSPPGTEVGWPQDKMFWPDCGAATMMSPGKNELFNPDRSPAFTCADPRPASLLEHIQIKAPSHWQPLLRPWEIQPSSSWTPHLRGRSPGIHHLECSLHFPPKPRSHGGRHPGLLATGCGENLQVISSPNHLEVPFFSPSGLG